MYNLTMTTERLNSQELNIDTKLYLRELAVVLGFQESCLSRAGMNMGRSRQGQIKERAQETIRVLISDDDFLYEDAKELGPEYIIKIRTDLDRGVIKPPSLIFTTQQRSFLTRLNVLYEWEKDHAKEPRGSEDTGSVGFFTIMAREMFAMLVERGEVLQEYEKIKDNPKKVIYFHDRLRIDLKDILYPVDPELMRQFVPKARRPRPKTKKSE